MRPRVFCEHSTEIIKVVCFFISLSDTSPDRNAAPFTKETDTLIYKNPLTHTTVPTGCKVTDDSPNKQRNVRVTMIFAQFSCQMICLTRRYIPKITPFWGIIFRKSRRFWELPQENNNFVELVFE